MSKTFFSKITGITASFLLPIVVAAQVVVNTGPLRTFFNQLLGIFNDILPFLLAIVVILLIVWAFQFATSAGDEEKRKGARDKIIWGLVGLVLLMSMYGITNILANLVLGTGTVLPVITEIPPIVQ